VAKEEYEEEVIEEMSGNWASPLAAAAPTPFSSSLLSGLAAVQVKGEGRPSSALLSVEDEASLGAADFEDPHSSSCNTSLADDENDDSPQRALLRNNLKRKRKSIGAGGVGGTAASAATEDDKGKKRLSCIDCGCRAALKACAKVMCIDCCAKEGLCDSHTKKLYEKEVRKLELSMPGGAPVAEKEPKEKDFATGSAPTASKAKKRPRVPLTEGFDKKSNVDQDDADEAYWAEEEGASPERRESSTTTTTTTGDNTDDESSKTMRGGVLFETVVKQDKKIRALQNDLKELRTLLLSVIDKQTAFSRQLRHPSGGTNSEGLIIDEDDDIDDDR